MYITSAEKSGGPNNTHSSYFAESTKDLVVIYFDRLRSGHSSRDMARLAGADITQAVSK